MNKSLVSVALGLLFGLSLVLWHRSKETVQQPVAPPMVEAPTVPIIPFIPEPPAKPEWKLDTNIIVQDKVKSHVYQLASPEFEGRMSGKSGHWMAANYAENEFEQMGLQTSRQRFSINRLNNGPKNEKGDDFTENVYAYIPGTTDEVVVIGAHIDHIGYGPSMSRSRQVAIHPGADDNASGVAVVLEAARVLAGSNPKRGIVFQVYSGEEMGLLGSRHYCDNPTFPPNGPAISKHVAMLNLDMVGFLKNHKITVGVSPSREIANSLKSLATKYPFANNVVENGGGSDHVSFHNKRVPVVFLNTGLHAHYHTPEDKPERLDYEGLATVARFSTELIWNLANGDKPVIRVENWKELPYHHDHGHPHVPFPSEHGQLDVFFPAVGQ